MGPSPVASQATRGQGVFRDYLGFIHINIKHLPSSRPLMATDASTTSLLPSTDDPVPCIWRSRMMKPRRVPLPSCWKPQRPQLSKPTGRSQGRAGPCDITKVRFICKPPKRSHNQTTRVRTHYVSQRCRWRRRRCEPSVVSGCNAPPVFDTTEHVFDAVALSVEGFVVR